MKVIKGQYEATLIILKSRFIAEAFRVDTVEDVAFFLAQTKKKYYDANHHCYAYRLKEDATIQKMSDDKEPAKTAGMPILDVLTNQELTNILVIVTRYFGGTLLGTGGLVRAYTQATQEVLKKVRFYELQKQMTFKLSLSYKAYPTLLKKMTYIHIKKASFSTEVVLEAYCHPDLFANIEKDAYTYQLGSLSISDAQISTAEIEIDTSF